MPSPVLLKTWTKPPLGVELRSTSSLIARGSLTLWLDEAVLSSWYHTGPKQRGAQYIYSDQAIEMALMIRSLLNLPLRQTQGFIHSVLILMGLDDLLAMPNYTTLSRRQGRLAVTVAVQPTKEPMHLVVDSTGLKVYRRRRVESAQARLDHPTDLA